MIRKRDPREPLLISRFDELLCRAAYNELKNGWEGLFRGVILALFPIAEVEAAFSHTSGRPTKELFSMTGLILLKDFFNWSVEETRKRYMTDLSVQYALNVEEDAVELSRHTLLRYIEWLRKKEFMQKAMIQLTTALIKKYNIKTDEQRHDSSHVFSNMAVWSRKKLLHQIIYRFLIQVKRHMKEEYSQLDAELRGRYERNDGWIFAETSPMKLQKQGKVYTSEEQLGYDMEKLIERFSGDLMFSNMASYKDLVRVFSEQFVDKDGKAELNPHPGGKVLLNPSDPDAEIGHKGPGYQVQITETCSEKNEVQLITAALPQGGSESDMDSLPAVEEKLKNEGHLPDELLADAGFGSDENFVKSAENGVKLIAPAPHQPENKVGLDECQFDPENRIVECPAGRKPIYKSFKNGKGRAVFFKKICDECPMKDQCRSRKCGKQNREFRYDDSDLRSRSRRMFESSDEFRKLYSKRSAIEGLNGRLKQFTPLRRLRIRGRMAVFHSIYAILTMHNIMQMVRYAKIQTKKAVAAALFRFFHRKFFFFQQNPLFHAA